MLKSLTNRPWIAALLVGGLLVAGAVMADYLRSYPADATPTFVGREKCADCHQSEMHAFLGSHHDKAMDLATDETVLGDFNDVTFEHDGLQNRLFRDGKKFMVHTEGQDGQMQDFEVKYVFGVDPLQQYMVEFDRNADTKDDEVARVQVLRISWDTQNKRWFYLRPPDVKEKLEPDDPLHWTGVAQRWQTMCAECHSTNLHRNYDVATQSYHTTFSEIDVSCEACHGPASLHVEMANSKSLFWDRHLGYGLARLKGEDTQPQIDTCAPCHSRRGVLDGTFHGGDSYHDFYSLELLRQDTYHADGQIKDEVYVYGSFIQSKMYHKGIRCSDCHDPHSLELKHKGNETCTSCHQHPAGKYDIPSHHHHAVGSEGAMCVNCHMPHTTYMEVDARRDHSFRIPRPDLSVSLGTPNACSGCHVKDQLESLPAKTQESLPLYQDWLLAAEQGNEQIAKAIAKTDQWCDDACEKWYGENRQTPTHYGETLAALRADDRDAVQKALRLIVRNESLAPVIARATALDEMTDRGHREGVTLAKKLIENHLSGSELQDPILLASAARAIGRAEPRMAKSVLKPLLDEDSRLVRSEAAKALVMSGAYATMVGTERSEVDKILSDVKDELMFASDRAGSHLGWAMLSEQRGRLAEALTAYQNAFAVEPGTTGPRTNLAALLDNIVTSSQQDARAAALLKEINSKLGKSSNIQDWIQRLRAEELPLLGRDANLAPNNPGLQYRYGLALYLAGDLPGAKKQLQRAVELAPEVEDFRMALRLLQEKIDSE
ncbi:multiheme c-type cytochrome [Neorhodopirellula lusitana]|uniref:multiheme c-type cytochrome n=1 Tax=Neorhodopirellula lusitana TaxID=445327 RepID=UPI00384FF155